eukprot:755710-Hanusia_phi.AAC.2
MKGGGEEEGEGWDEGRGGGRRMGRGERRREKDGTRGEEEAIFSSSPPPAGTLPTSTFGRI